MRSEDRETLFWALSELADPTSLSGSAVPDSTLEAYRAGRLSEDEAHFVEQQLVANAANRRRLEELAGLEPSAAPMSIRRRVLAGNADATAEAPDRGASLVRRRGRLAWRMALAAAAIAVLAIGALILRPRQPALPALPAYQVQIAALTEFRDLAEPGSAAEAYAASKVTITATVVEHARAGVEVGLYRVAGGRLERLTEDRFETLERRGVVELTVPAAELTGSEPGDHEIFVAIGWSDQLPAAITLSSGSDPMAELAAGGLQVHRLTLRLLAGISCLPHTCDPSDEEVARVSYSNCLDCHHTHQRFFGHQPLDSPGIRPAHDFLGVLSTAL